LDRGNVKIMTVMGDIPMNGLSDRGSIPLSSIKKIKTCTFARLDISS